MPDPISVLPPEVAWRCIFEALSFRKHEEMRRNTYIRFPYPMVLLQLTTVSRYWENLILSTPAFWTEIHVHNSAQDFLSTLAVFLALSRKRELELVIWDYPVDEWNRAQELLLPHVPRVRVLTILTQRDRFPDYENTLHPLSTTSAVIKDLNLSPYLKDLDLGHSYDWLFTGDSYDKNIRWLGDITLPSHIRVSSSIYGVFNQSEWNHVCLEHFTALYTDSTLGDVAPALGSLTNLSTLKLWEVEEAAQRDNWMNVVSIAPPHLKVIASAKSALSCHYSWSFKIFCCILNSRVKYQMHRTPFHAP